MADQTEASAKGSPAEQKNLLESGHLRVEVLPALGGKIASITLLPSGGELLQGPLKPYALRTATQPFDTADGSGWDECLPSIGPCNVPFGEGKTASIQDHGDFWRLPFSVTEATQQILRMHAVGTSLPILFERGLRLEERTLHLDYSITNQSDTTIPFGWSVHPLFAVQPYDVIHLPHSATEVTAQASADGRLGSPGSKHAWPLTTNALDGQPLDISVAGSIDDGVGDKLVLPSPAEGWCALERKTLRTLVTLHFDPKRWPTLGLWLCYGGWPAAQGSKKGYTVALEPCNLPLDSLADSLAQGTGGHLTPGETVRWNLKVVTSATEER